MLKLLLEINYAINAKFNKRIGLKKRIYNIITKAIINIPKDNVLNLFSHESEIDKELTSLLIVYKKTYNLNTQIMTNICENAISIIDNFCYIMDNRSIYCSNLYNNINHQKFIDKVLIEAFKND